MNTLLYFSYGSNMSTPRLMKRAQSAQAITVARLEGHRLMFHKRGKDGSGKCDIAHTNEPDDVVYGVVFKLLASEKLALDKIEGLGNGYNEKCAPVIGHNGETLNIVTYYATDINSSLKPHHWYKEHVVRGAKEHRLPLEYINSIENIESVPDSDIEKHENELSIYRR